MYPVQNVAKTPQIGCNPEIKVPANSLETLNVAIIEVYKRSIDTSCFVKDFVYSLIGPEPQNCPTPACINEKQSLPQLIERMSELSNIYTNLDEIVYQINRLKGENS